jgi:O-antigen/teichoic acid export membrane protein
MPMLTRIYKPDEFGMLAVFSAFLGITSVVAGLQYEVAIPIPELDETAANLLGVALFCIAVTSGLSAVAIALFSAEIANLLNLPSIRKFLWLLPISIAGTGAYAAFQFWAVRKRAFPRIARTRLVQSLGGAVTQLLMGWAGTGALGLITGQIVNNSAGFLGLGRGAVREDEKTLRGISIIGMKKAAADFKRFPKYTAIENFANVGAIQVPFLLIANRVASAEVGFLMLGMRLMQAPMSLVGSAVSHVYYSHAVTEHRDGRLAEFTSNVIGNLARVGVGPLIFMGIIAPSVFMPVFGMGWQRAGVLVAWMTPWFVFQFLSSPVSMVLYVTSNQRAAMALQISGLILRVVMVLIAAAAVAGHPVVESYALSGFVFYFGYLIVICRVSKITMRQLLKACKCAIPFVSGWIIAGIIIVSLA